VTSVEATPPLDLGTPPAPTALPVSRLSYSGIEDYSKCGYRFYVRRALKLPAAEMPASGAAVAPPAEVEPGLSPLLRGSIVHLLLERLDFRRPLVPSEGAVRELLAEYGHDASEPELEDLRGMVAAFVDSPLRERLARATRTRTELQFAFTLDPGGRGGRSVLMNGVVDVHAAEPDGTLIVDYKSDRLEGRDPVVVCDEDYGTQRIVYALAVLRAGSPRAEVVHLFLERAAEPVSAMFTADDVPRLERELRALAGGLVEARFEPTGEPHYELCAGCPAQPALCSWPPERTLAPR